MGCCFSSQTNAVASSTAKVISVDGTLHEYSVPATVAHVLKSERESDSLFVCNSDKLYFDQRIPPLDPSEELQVGQIYFVLPISKLHYPLTASDMAAMAVKASEALNEEEPKESSRRRWRRRKKIQISPVLEVDQGLGDGDFDGFKIFEKEYGGLARSGSVRKMQRNASRRAKTAYRSFRSRLTTIYEISVSE
ncbi:uncharacterized protein LOC131249585 [Magnolia sinica]|uniref:uncharacterized protein LOC131249585 n=1 Tax=Magnolia sinica TaxID=86752 RepID=UPI0026588C8F|nr:uncharacterized protein LOC131249585 [Magnolia sinica]